MHRKKLATTAFAAGALLLTSFAGPGWTSTASARAGSGTAESYLVLAEKGASVAALTQRLEAAGAQVTAVNEQIGLFSVSADSAFASRAGALAGVQGVATDRVIGRTPDAKPVSVEHEAAALKPSKKLAPATPSAKTPPKAAKTDPLDSQLWGMRMINADQAHAITLGSRRVRVGVMDTGVQGDHPDLQPNFDEERSRNFVTDIPEIDGDCEFDGCVDPANVDHGGHGTHVAGTIAAAMNGLGLSGVAPKVDLVNVRAGQDSGYFFLQPTVDALTYSGDAGLDVVNMSFYVDPWLYNCAGGAPEDSPEQAADQDLIIAAMTRALDYAHGHGVTLVAATGNSHEDLANPRVDTSSPDYGAPTHDRTIDNETCWDLPVEGPHVIGVDALGPSARKSDFSNYTTDLDSGEVEVSAPGGWFRDGLGTDGYRTNGNLILSTYPLGVLQDEGQVDEFGNITPDGEDLGTQKVCQADPVPGTTACGYYTFLQGTSMASPHAAGVAALAVAAHGQKLPNGDFGLAPSAVRSLLMGTATDHACPTGGVQSYTDVGRSAEFTATCVGTPAFNGFYGDGIVNALGVVQ